MTQRRIAGIVLLLATFLAIAIAAGCSGSRATRKTASTPAVDARVHDPLWRSKLRERALAFLGDAAFHEHAQMRANAIEAMQAAPSRLVPVLTAALRDHNQGVRSVAAMTIGKLEIVELAPMVAPLLQDDSLRVQAAAIYAMRRCGQQVDPTPLAAMLRHRDAWVRAQAAFALGGIGDASAVPMLRSAAADLPVFASSSEQMLLRLQIAEALVKLGETSAIEMIRARLYASRPEELEATALAIQILGELQDRGAQDNLLYVTAQTDGSAEIRLAAAGALAKMGNRRGGFIAAQYWNDPLDVLRAQAVHVYGLTGDAESLMIAEELLEDMSPLVCVTAAGAVLRLTAESEAP